MSQETNNENAAREAGQSKLIPILSRHASLSEAVAAAKIDLSYNEREAAAKIRHTEATGAGESYVTAEGVFYVYKCDITLLNKFEPFHGCIDNCPFQVVLVRENAIEIFTGVRIPKSMEARRIIARGGLMVTAF